jgi:hypothetical protein
VAVVRRPVGIKQDLPERTWLVVVLRCLVVAVAVFRAILPVVVIFVVVSMAGVVVVRTCMRGVTPGRRVSAVRVPREQQQRQVVQVLRQKMMVALLDVLQGIVNCVVVGAACYSQLLVVVCASYVVHTCNQT